MAILAHSESQISATLAAADVAVSARYHRANGPLAPSRHRRGAALSRATRGASLPSARGHYPILNRCDCLSHGGHFTRCSIFVRSILDQACLHDLCWLPLVGICPILPAHPVPPDWLRYLWRVCPMVSLGVFATHRSSTNQRGAYTWT